MSTDLTLPEPNIPLLRKAVEWAEAEAAKPEGQSLWRQEWWAEQTKCGTAYCIAGFAAMNGHASASLAPCPCGCEERVLMINGEQVSWGEAGQEALGLTDDERGWLFAGGNDLAEVRQAAECIAARAGERL